MTDNSTVEAVANAIGDEIAQPKYAVLDDTPALDAARAALHGLARAAIAALPDNGKAELVKALKQAEGHLEEMRRDAKWHPIGHCPVLDRIRAVLAKHGA